MQVSSPSWNVPSVSITSHLQSNNASKAISFASIVSLVCIIAQPVGVLCAKKGILPWNRFHVYCATPVAIIPWAAKRHFPLPKKRPTNVTAHFFSSNVPFTGSASSTGHSPMLSHTWPPNTQLRQFQFSQQEHSSTEQRTFIDETFGH